MFSRKKTAAVVLALGSLTAICAGATDAYAGQPHGTCTHDRQGNLVCTDRSETDSTYTTSDGTFHVNQTRDCTTTTEPTTDTPQIIGIGQLGSTHVGPVIDCSNHVPTPKGFKLPSYLR
ncbi:hypothetical protein GXW82_32580 [Streptacidiphilus sp. 4-A2]|nr:hypothetical protein [Streptacidiphilus sp. 4-A2]